MSFGRISFPQNNNSYLFSIKLNLPNIYGAEVKNSEQIYNIFLSLILKKILE